MVGGAWGGWWCLVAWCTGMVAVARGGWWCLDVWSLGVVGGGYKQVVVDGGWWG